MSDLEKKKKDITEQFNKLEEKVAELNKLIMEARQEQLKLQGEFRLIEDLLKEKVEENKEK